MSRKFMYNTKTFVDKAIKKFNNKFDYSLCEYTKSQNIIVVICPKHGQFEIVASNHLRSKDGGCKLCQLEKSKNNEYFDLVKKLHNNFYDYTKSIYKNKNSKITITCPIHGDFKQYAGNHLKGHGCQKCSIDKTRSQLENIIEKLVIKHNNYYDYSLLKYENSHSIIKIICPKHGIFEQAIQSHLKGSGCPKCDNERHTLTTEEFIQKANIKHNNKYVYTNTKYINTRKKVIITCPIHGNFEQTPSAHIHGHGCPFCRESKGEEKIKKYLDKNNIKYIRQHKFDDCKNQRKLPFDFYLTEHNTCIEFDGKQHFISLKYFGGESALKYRQYNDTIKNKYCQSNNIHILRIKYNDNINLILDKFLIDMQIF